MNGDVRGNGKFRPSEEGLQLAEERGTVPRFKQGDDVGQERDARRGVQGISVTHHLIKLT